MTVWLNIEEAAKRVRRSKRTIKRWEEQGLIRRVLDAYSQDRLLAVDKEMRARQANAGQRLRPKGVASKADMMRRVTAEISRWMRELDPTGEREWLIEAVEDGGITLRPVSETRPTAK